ncbi:hypothetical protein [Pseudobdellovibrio sp. HCB154]|uniref:hypothetical protein n=1 Tax=Pseudobdellovibrio sp. HCB154 TaxID=3386277 RepID=UPI00391728E1
MKLIIGILIFFSTVTAFSQENDLGPNGGQLKLVGEFYSEVLTNKDGSFDVYLLDKETKKPSVRYSYVTGFFESNGGTKVEILCVAQKTYFECYPRGLNIKKGKKLSLSMARENVTGNDVVYNLPIFNPKDLASAQGRIAYAIKFDKDQKYMSFRNGKRGYETSTQLEAGGSYCAIENIKLQKLSIKPKKKFTTKIEKIDFPNKEVQRYSVINNRDYNLYCDFTADADFKQSLVIEKINQHLNGWLKIK